MMCKPERFLKQHNRINIPKTINTKGYKYKTKAKR